MWKPPPRSARTSIPCPECHQPLTARRTCHQAYLQCEACRREYPLAGFIRQMDRALEEFLEAIHCDRV